MLMDGCGHNGPGQPEIVKKENREKKQERTLCGDNGYLRDLGCKIKLIVVDCQINFHKYNPRTPSINYASWTMFTGKVLLPPCAFDAL